jgi:tryptophan-rich sensory protein
MKKFNRFIQIIWLVIAAVAAVEAYIAFGKGAAFRNKFYLMAFVFAASIAMYAIRKRQGRSIK